MPATGFGAILSDPGQLHLDLIEFLKTLLPNKVLHMGTGSYGLNMLSGVFQTI